MSISISQLKYYSISMDQDKYVTSIVEKYLDTATIKENPIFRKTTFIHDMIFTREDSSTSYEQVEIIYRE